MTALPPSSLHRVCLFLLLLVPNLLLPACRSRPATRPATGEPVEQVLSPELRRKNLDSFDYVWTTIRDKHWDPTLGGLDWQGVRDELRPKMEQADTMPAARAVLVQMIGRLKQSHFGIIPASIYVAQERVTAAAGTGATTGPGSEQAERSGRGVSGISLRVVDGRALVFRVQPGSGAADTGVKPGWVLLAVNGADVSPMLERLAAAYTDPAMQGAMQSATLEQLLAGAPGAALKARFLDDQDREVEKSITLTRPGGSAAQFGNLPTFYVHFDARRLPSDVLYTSLNGFFDPPHVIGGFGQAMRENRDARGLIIDLRGNPGGIGAMAMGIGNYLVSKPDQRLGTLTLRGGTFHFILNPRADTFDGPVAILVDERSMSTSEILAGGLQDLGRARVFGTRTPGAALPSTVEKMPNGDRFQYAFANYVSSDGEPLEGHGVVPDEPVALDRAALLRGEDPAMDAAVRWIQSQSSPSNQAGPATRSR